MVVTSKTRRRNYYVVLFRRIQPTQSGKQCIGGSGGKSQKFLAAAACRPFICFFGTVLASLNRTSLGDIAAEDPSEYMYSPDPIISILK